jgi:sugar/nucleoside kinase (ribokinase family)
MRHLLLAAATLATALGIGVGNVEAASFALDSLANSGVQTVDVRYYRRHPSHYYYRRGGDPSYTSRHCYNRDEIRELQRMWPETNWPRSMRCFPYR